jgi:hypothetical protein
VRPLFFFRFPPDPLRERERQNVMDAFERLYRFYPLNMTCIKLALLSHPVDRVRVSNWRSICFLNGEMKSGHPYASTADAPAGAVTIR